jgi:hypothetical protein
MVLSELSKYSMKMLQNGGVKTMLSPQSGSNFLIVFILSLIFLFIKAWLIQITYNGIGPKLMVNIGANITNFQPLTFMDAVLLTILAQNLFN